MRGLTGQANQIVEVLRVGARTCSDGLHTGVSERMGNNLVMSLTTVITVLALVALTVHWVMDRQQR